MAGPTLLPVEILHPHNLYERAIHDIVRDAAALLFLQADLDSGPRQKGHLGVLYVVRRPIGEVNPNRHKGLTT